MPEYTVDVFQVIDKTTYPWKHKLIDSKHVVADSPIEAMRKCKIKDPDNWTGRYEGKAMGPGVFAFTRDDWQVGVYELAKNIE